ncbi:putative transport protein particle (TRAPP) subunit [Leptomonas seymouri]|uniref:Putative transport protein particle (TRAPP) subunit n=1 Tax=Leptomonas seymouri TaxID=5684 RepID=A0A0N0P4G1_LEPSE|nr:putative transport protein particle (TRAPP) subunit [Leptomonas seymouri]|eukprot:KPI85256.1 putative transport protein particle (TRAPP) subunit [Leptomonas seymouri]
MSRPRVVTAGKVVGEKGGAGLSSSEHTQVALSAFSFLFCELCIRAYTFPAKVKNVEEVEARLTSLGAHVGTRLIMLSSVRDPLDLQRRPLTIDAVLKLLQEKLWLRWFGRSASDIQRESNSDRFFLFDSDPLVLKYVHPSPDYIDSEGRWNVNYASFMGGIIQGALQSMGFEAEVQTYHQPAPGKPHQSLFVVAFAKHVWDRERKMRT